MRQRKKVAILISGRGSNMGALIRAAEDTGYPAEIAAVISDKADAPGLRIASAAGIRSVAVPRADFPDKAAHEKAIEEALAASRAELVCLAGFMRLLSAGFVERWQGRMLNIHPSLLPLFPGLSTHRRALQSGMRIHGCTVHFVTHEMDSGPIIAQAAVPVLPGDTEDTLSARVLEQEHQLYPLALALVASGKARIKGGRTIYAATADIGWTERAHLIIPSPAEASLDLEDLARRTP
ncbi:phosphoribosylglycinamide formyltransferase [Chelativorans sp. Marseille-P2723]|uniref:phosphoribosylglycinamide formyltransferase n=1 Tax=Chelativorans sp. Marseille-P2723 TaxID=2709133 RepID=UPI00156DCC16|nr:phosphoribosylglycinamide formyltransferase [Chelativorans sp. Marseille-P2723]